MRISEMMATELAGELAMTRSLLARIPDDELEWQPPGQLHTVAWNAVHLVEILGWVSGIVSQTEWDVAPVGAPPYVPPKVTRASQLLEMFDASSQQALAALQGVPDPAMDEPWSLKMGG